VRQNSWLGLFDYTRLVTTRLRRQLNTDPQDGEREHEIFTQHETAVRVAVEAVIDQATTAGVFASNASQGRSFQEALKPPTAYVGRPAPEDGRLLRSWLVYFLTEQFLTGSIWESGI